MARASLGSDFVDSVSKVTFLTFKEFDQENYLGLLSRFYY